MLMQGRFHAYEGYPLGKVSPLKDIRHITYFLGGFAGAVSLGRIRWVGFVQVNLKTVDKSDPVGPQYIYSIYVVGISDF
jgi:hypothetical protein